MGDHEVIVLLHIAEANGLYNRNEHVVITASLGGITLESETQRPGQTTIFDINLVWETDKKVIKRMKTENLPIKLECFSVNGSVSRRQLIGFVMIPIRGVPIVSGSKPPKCVPRWHKLMGLSPDWKSLKPEISMYSSIMDPHQASALASVQRDSKSLESVSTSNMLCSQQGLHIKLLPDDHCIQLGCGADDCVMYVVHIELRSLKGLRMSADGDSDKFHIQYILFGSPSEDRLLVPTTGGQFSILEKINIHFRASLATIRDYFQKVFYIPIEVYCNNSVIGRIRFSVLIPPPLDPTARRAKIYEVYDRCYFAPSATATALFAPIDGEDAPWIEYEFVLELLHPLSPQLSPQLQLSPQPDVQQQPPPVEAVALELPAASSSSIDFGGAGDQPKTRTPHSQRVSLVRTENNNNNVSTTAIMPVEQAGSPAPAPWSVALTPNTAKVTPKTFSYQLTLQQVRFTRKVEPGIWQVSLHHPKAHTPIALLNISVRETSTASTFENVTVELLFSFAASGIRSVIESEPCVLNIKGPHAIFATAELDNGTLLGQQRTAGIVLMENEAGEKIAMAHAYVELTDLGANLNAQQPKFTRFAQPNGGGGGGGAAGSSCGGGGGGGGARLKPHLDEELAYKMVEELEQWKTQQQDSFLVELKRREINHLARLTTEWTRRRSELEALLTQKFEQCSQLTSALEVANKNVRDKQLDDMDRQRLWAQARCDLEKSCKKKLLQLQEQARRCEDDAAYEAKLAVLRHKELQLRYDQLVLEHRQCKELLAEMGAELERSSSTARIVQPTTTTTTIGMEQANRLLEEMHQMNERLNNVQSSAIFRKPSLTQRDDNNATNDFDIAVDESDVSITELLDTERAHLLEEQQELQAIAQTLEQQHNNN